MDERKKVGNEGEYLVCEYLTRQGHSILERNYRAGHLEIDIISLDSAGLHFIEVKTRRPPLQANPQDCVTVPKQIRVAKAAQRFLHSGRHPELELMECHFDVASVIINKGTHNIEYINDAFIPMFFKHMTKF